MAQTIIVHAAEPVACPKCNHRFPLTEGLSRQAIERHAGEYERALAAGRKELEARVAAEAKAQYEIQAKALADSLGVKDRLLARFRDEELGLRRQLRELEEAKKNRAWQPAWLRNLKDEQQEIGAESAVIATSAMPKDAREPFLRDSDVWITRHDAARPLAECLRAALVELAKQRQANLGRSEKMEVLYSYICSPQFAGRLKSLYDGFVT